MIIQIGRVLNHKGNIKVYYQIKEKFISVIRYISKKPVVIFAYNIFRFTYKFNSIIIYLMI